MESDSKDRFLRRLGRADCALELLYAGELPRVQKLLFSTTFQVREFVDEAKFEALTTEDEELAELLAASTSKAFIRPSLVEEQIQFVLFHGKEYSEADSLLYSRTLGVLIALTYAVLGLDMNSVLQLSADTEHD